MGRTDGLQIEIKQLSRKTTMTREKMPKIEELKEYIATALVKRFSESDRKKIDRYLNRSLPVILRDLLPIAVSEIRHDRYKDDEDVKLLAVTQFRKVGDRLR